MNSFPPNIILTGFSGTGKTTSGQIAARQLDWRFVDTNDEVVIAANTSIPALLERSEALFRQYERVICLQTALGHHQVIATGDGALLNPNIKMAFEASGMIICLDASLDTIIERLDHQGGYTGGANIIAGVLATRQSLYDSLPYHIDTNGKTPEQVAEEIIALYQSAL